MDVDERADTDAAGIAQAIADPARARMLYALMDGHARTGIELAAVADVGAPTASAHLARLKAAGLVKVEVQGRHRYHRLAGPEVAQVLEGLSVLAGARRPTFAPSTPSRLRPARTCYDHLAGEIGVCLHDRFKALGYLAGEQGDYDISPAGAAALSALGIDVEGTRRLRRRFAYDCLDWSERRPHLGGALGAAVLKLALARAWVTQDLDSRAVTVTDRGRRELRTRFGVEI